MSVTLVFSFIIFSIYLISQFGGRIAARTSGLWWGILVFLGVIILHPQIMQPIANFLGVKVVSNLMLAILIGFLIKESLENSARSTRLERSLRGMATEHASEFFLAHREPKAPQDKRKALIFIPTFNEEANLPTVMAQMDALREKAEEFHLDICFVDDGSLDRSRQLLSDRMPGSYTFHPVNCGVSGGLLTAAKILRKGDYDYLVQCDADGQHPVSSIPGLLQVASRQQADLLIGSRFTRQTDGLISPAASGDRLESTTVSRRAGGVLISLMLQLFEKKAAVSDPTSGFRVYSRQAVHHLEKNMPDDYPEPESIALLSLVKSFRIAEVLVKMEPRKGGSSSISGWHSLQFMTKVATALIALRMRTLIAAKQR